jgi:mono/diheme cytochrome c family protein
MPRSLLATALFLAGATLSTASSAAFDAAGYFQMRCAACHGAEGQGTRASIPPLGPALKGNPFVVNGSPAALRTVVRKGRSGKKRLYNDAYPNMPSFGAEAVPDVDALVAYIKGDLQR